MGSDFTSRSRGWLWQPRLGMKVSATDRAAALQRSLRLLRDERRRLARIDDHYSAQRIIIAGSSTSTTVLPTELVNAPARVENLLLTGIEGVACGTDLNVQFILQG
jgi:hypothetical protein